MIAVLVTGSREWSDRKVIESRLMEHETLAMQVDDGTWRLLIHGDARGADRTAASIAHRLGWQVLPMPAQWQRDGKRAGPDRNRRMVEVLLQLSLCGWDVAVEAFPLGASPGTRNCIREAMACAFGPVLHITEGGR